MAKDYIKINTPLELAYHRGNIVVYYKYNHKVFRYNLLKIDSKLYIAKPCGLKIFQLQKFHILTTFEQFSCISYRKCCGLSNW